VKLKQVRGTNISDAKVHQSSCATFCNVYKKQLKTLCCKLRGLNRLGSAFLTLRWSDLAHNYVQAILCKTPTLRSRETHLSEDFFAVRQFSLYIFIVAVATFADTSVLREKMLLSSTRSPNILPFRA